MPQPITRTLINNTATATPEFANFNTDLDELDLFESLLHDPVNTSAIIASDDHISPTTNTVATVPITQDSNIKKNCDDDIILPIDIPFYNLLDPIVENGDISISGNNYTTESQNPPLTTLSPQLVELTPVATISIPTQSKIDWDLSLDDLLNSITNSTTTTDTNVSSPSLSSISSTSLSLSSPTTVIPKQLSSPLIKSMKSFSSPLNYYSTNSQFSSFASSSNNSTTTDSMTPVTSPNYEYFSPTNKTNTNNNQIAPAATTTPAATTAPAATITPISSTPTILNQMEGIPRSRGRKPSLVDDQLKVFHCKYCARKFKRQEHLKRHFKSLHLGNRPFLCSTCNKHFSRRDNLNQHIKTHRNT